jgi:hypothetical protein
VHGQACKRISLEQAEEIERRAAARDVVESAGSARWPIKVKPLCEALHSALLTGHRGRKRR